MPRGRAAGGYSWQGFEDTLHQGARADQIADSGAARQLVLPGFDFAEIPKCLPPPPIT